MTANNHKRRSSKDPVGDQLRFEAALYGDWYSRSIHTSYVQDQSEKHRDVDVPDGKAEGTNTLPDGH